MLHPLVISRTPTPPPLQVPVNGECGEAYCAATDQGKVALDGVACAKQGACLELVSLPVDQTGGGSGSVVSFCMCSRWD